MIWSRALAIAVVAFVGVSACGGSGSDAIADGQKQVEARGATVMPFEQNRTTHVFHSTATGGARIVYTISEPRLVTALHHWFDAQLMDHGSDAHG